MTSENYLEGFTNAKVIIWHSEGIAFTHYSPKWKNINDLIAVMQEVKYIQRVRIFDKKEEVHIWKTKIRAGNMDSHEFIKSAYGNFRYRRWSGASNVEKLDSFVHPDVQIMSGTSVSRDGEVIVFSEDRGVNWSIPAKWLEESKVNNFNKANSKEDKTENYMRLILKVEGLYRPDEEGMYSLHDYRYKDIKLKEFKKQEKKTNQQ